MAVGVRAFHWRDAWVAIEDGRSPLATLSGPYRPLTRDILEGRGVLFRSPPPDPGNAKPVLHPPGYSIVSALAERVFGGGDTTLRWLHILVTAGAAAFLYILSRELVSVGAAVAAGLLAALSPHLANYTLLLTPDSLAPVPLLGAVFLLARARRDPRVWLGVAAGALIGISCWLRSNALLLAPVLAAACFVLFERGRRTRVAFALATTAAVVILPITVRNAIVYGKFLPISIGSGITLVEGIADYDPERRFGMPQYDSEVPEADARWHGRTDYARSLYRPDGIERDQARLARGLEVIRENPGWFAGVMVRRAWFMLQTNNETLRTWPVFTANVPVVEREVTYGSTLGTAPGALGVPVALRVGAAVSPGTEARSGAEDALEILGNDRPFGDQFVSAPIAVRTGTDYIVKLEARSIRGRAAVKVTDLDGRYTLAAVAIGSSPQARDGGMSAATPAGAVRLAFATGGNEGVRIAVSNNGEQAYVRVRDVQASEIGPTPGIWTRPARVAVRAFQRNVYFTWRLLPVAALGALLLLGTRSWRRLVLVSVVPLYYLAFQSPVHTEYRYVLGIQYFLFILVGTALAALVWIVRPALLSGGRGALSRVAAGRPRRGRGAPAPTPAAAERTLR